MFLVAAKKCFREPRTLSFSYCLPNGGTQGAGRHRKPKELGGNNIRIAELNWPKGGEGMGGKEREGKGRRGEEWKGRKERKERRRKKGKKEGRDCENFGLWKEEPCVTKRGDQSLEAIWQTWKLHRRGQSSWLLSFESAESSGRYFWTVRFLLRTWSWMDRTKSSQNQHFVLFVVFIVTHTACARPGLMGSHTTLGEGMWHPQVAPAGQQGIAWPWGMGKGATDSPVCVTRWSWAYLSAVSTCWHNEALSQQENQTSSSYP